jgi:hypothetical protein
MMLPWLLGEDDRPRAAGSACCADEDALFRPLRFAWCGCLAAVIGAVLGLALFLSA